MRRWMLCLSIVGLTAAAPAVAHAADDTDARWTPKRFSQSELIEFGTFAQSPLELPWTVTRTEEVTNYGRIDFKHHLEADVREVTSYLMKKYKAQKPALKMRKGLLAKGKSRELYVVGTATQQDVRNFTLTNDDLRRQFVVRLKEEDGRAALIYENMALTQVFGPGTPKLAPFKPVDADPIPVD